MCRRGWPIRIGWIESADERRRWRDRKRYGTDRGAAASANIRHSQANIFSGITRTQCDRPMLTFFLWCLLLVFCWPLAIFVLLVYPLVWVVLLPFRLIGLTCEAIFETLEAALTLPARIARRLA
jgi:hypothetical protein